jgi:hypothetical protein
MSSQTGIILTSKQVQLVEPTFGDSPMTTADSVDCTLIGLGAVISTTAMSYTEDLEETDTWGWFANINLPATPQTVHVHVEANKSGAKGRWHETIKVRNFV